MKTFARDIYYRARYAPIFFSRLVKSDPPDPARMHRVTPLDGDYFFGYYDKCPWDSKNEYLLALRATIRRRMPRPNDTCDICLVATEGDSDPIRIGSTSAWCWQQGAMLQWLPSIGDDILAYNHHEAGKYVSVLSNTRGKRVATLSLPIYAIDRKGRTILSLDFDRLHYARPGYGYVMNRIDLISSPCPHNNGIFALDVPSGRAELIISLEQIAKIEPRPEFKDSIHYFNHLEFSPDSLRFVFFHRWRSRLDGKEYTRMFTARPDGSDIYLLADTGMVSHYCWLSDTTLLAWARHPSQGNRYYIFEDKSNVVTVMGNDILTEDGHPSLSPDGRWILTDTYPDKRRVQHLLLYDRRNLRKQEIASFFVPFGFDGPVRCDLHPRWRRDGTAVCVDSVQEGRRAIYLADMSSILAKT